MKTETLPQTAECGSEIANAHLSTRIDIETKTRRMLARNPATVTLYHASPGYVIAGSCMRLQSTDVYGYEWHDGRAFHGRTFQTLSQAKQHFDAIN